VSRFLTLKSGVAPGHQLMSERRHGLKLVRSRAKKPHLIRAEPDIAGA
jgi:hypothetical protein